jgi:hypothetical protein
MMLDFKLDSVAIGKLVIPSDYPNETDKKIFYRYDGIGKVWETRFELIKETPCGYWITDLFDHDHLYKRWVSKTARKRYAYPTREGALKSYIKRKEKQIVIMESDLSLIKAGLEEVKKEYNKEIKNED